MKCGISSTPHVISGVGRTMQGKLNTSEMVRSIRRICVSSLEVLQINRQFVFQKLKCAEHDLGISI